MTDTAGPKPYEQSPEPRKSRKVYWIVGSLILAAIVLGTCVNGGIKAFKAVSARSAATDEIVRQFMADGLPPASDRYIRQYGAVTEFSSPNCTIRSAANTDAAKSGTFADCAMSVVSEESPGRVTVQWVREDEAWKIIGFNVTYSDQSVLLDKAEQADKILPDTSEAAAEDQTDPAAEE